MIRFELPLKTPSVANLREHHFAKAKRVAAQRRAAMLKCPKWSGGPLLVVTLTRVGPSELDSDNLASALKGIRDGVAARLGIDDGSKLVRWEYAQAKGEPSVRVDIRANAAPDAPSTSALDEAMRRTFHRAVKDSLRTFDANAIESLRDGIFSDGTLPVYPAPHTHQGGHMAAKKKAAKVSKSKARAKPAPKTVKAKSARKTAAKKA